MNIKKHFYLYSNCIPVKGFKRSAIYDLTRQNYCIIPNELYEILNDRNGKSIERTLKKYGKLNIPVIREYFEFLFEKEFIFECESNVKNKFPSLALQYNTPNIISNAIIQISLDSNLNYNEIFEELDQLGNIDLQIQFTDVFSLEQLSSILFFTKEKRIRYIELLLPEIVNLSKNELLSFLSDNYRVSKVVFFKCCAERILNSVKWENDLARIYFTGKDLLQSGECGKVSTTPFIVNMNFFLESINYNNCLNNKICIDSEGNIKNCLHINESFGNIRNESIVNVVHNKRFRSKWLITKDMVDSCKDCEYRYMCSDCRALTKNGNLFSKPLDCKFNPYD